MNVDLYWFYRVEIHIHWFPDSMAGTGSGTTSRRPSPWDERFPLGLASVKSQAASPLLGHVLAQTGVIGHTIVVILLIGSGLAIAVSLVIRPPRDVPAATIRLVLGLSAMFILAPSTRFGYFIYPAAMVLWLLVAQAGRKAAEPHEPDVLVSG